MKMKIDHPIITGVVLDKEGPLENKTLERIEQIGLELSDKLNGTVIQTIKNQRETQIKRGAIKAIVRSLKWILIGGGPIFFFIRAIYLGSTGGDCFGTINPGFSWFLLFLEIFVSGTTGVSALLGLALLKLSKENVVVSGKVSLKNLILFTGVSSYSIHFVRVGIWIGLCVI
jgi:hypothetical protein